MRLLGCIQMLIHQLPRRLDADPQQQILVATHVVAPARNPVPSMAQPLTGFNLE
jgi:hypothetical protein